MAREEMPVPPAGPEGSDSGPTSPIDRKVANHYEALRNLARQLVHGKQGQRLLDPTELVHESYMRLLHSSAPAPERRTEFLALAVTVLRNVLVDHARERNTLRRGGQLQRVTLDGQALQAPNGIDLLALDDLLHKLARLDARQARVVELKLFGGLTGEEIARLIGISSRQVDEDWAHARAWLRREYQPRPGEAGM